MAKIEKDGVTVEFVEVTPQLAKKWLDNHNKLNRNMRFRVVGSYATDMEADEWDLNGETVKFADDGTLIDGQHRLQGIVDSNKTLTLIVVRGLPKSAQATIDRNSVRRFSDTLKLAGEPNHLALAALIRAVFMWKKGFRRPSTRYIPSGKQLMHTLEAHPELPFIISRAATVGKKSGLPPSVVGVCMWAFEQVGPEDTDLFFDRLADGQNIAKGNPIYELRRQSLEWRGDRSKRNTLYLVAVVIKAWNAYREGRNVELLSYRAGGHAPEKFPEPI